MADLDLSKDEIVNCVAYLRKTFGRARRIVMLKLAFCAGVLVITLGLLYWHLSSKMDVTTAGMILAEWSLAITILAIIRAGYLDDQKEIDTCQYLLTTYEEEGECEFVEALAKQDLSWCKDSQLKFLWEKVVTKDVTWKIVSRRNARKEWSSRIVVVFAVGLVITVILGVTRGKEIQKFENNFQIWTARTDALDKRLAGLDSTAGRIGSAEKTIMKTQDSVNGVASQLEKNSKKDSVEHARLSNNINQLNQDASSLLSNMDSLDKRLGGQDQQIERIKSGLEKYAADLDRHKKDTLSTLNKNQIAGIVDSKTAAHNKSDVALHTSLLETAEARANGKLRDHESLDKTRYDSLDQRSRVTAARAGIYICADNVEGKYKNIIPYAQLWAIEDVGILKDAIKLSSNQEKNAFAGAIKTALGTLERQKSGQSSLDWRVEAMIKDPATKGQHEGGLFAAMLKAYDMISGGADSR